MKKIIGLVILLTFTFSFKKEEKPKKAPQIELAGPDGKIIKLSSLRGKMVLIDFWASWCGPCRGENPNVVEAYLEYKDAKFKNGKGFEVYSVSLDRTNAPWVQAIEKDKLIWTSHVIDAKGEVSKLYAVKSIPSAFLIDGKGNIVAQGPSLRGKGLQNALKERLK